MAVLFISGVFTRTSQRASSLSFCSSPVKVSTFAPSSRRHRPLVAAQGATLCAIATPIEPVSLSKLELRPYIDDQGRIPYDDNGGKVGVYAIYDQYRRLLYVGKSRDVRNSLRMHLIRKPRQCYWFSVQNVQKPSRTALEGIARHWIEEWDGEVEGNDGATQQKLWENPIDVLGEGVDLLEEEENWLEHLEDRDRPSVLKKICRRIQRDIESLLKERGVTEPLKFAPQLKNRGLLDIASQKVEVPETL